MDTHFTPGKATAEEQQAVDSVVGESGPATRNGSDRPNRNGPAAPGGDSAGGQRHLLLPVLHAIQARIGWISPFALNYACQRLDVAPAEAYGVASFYGLFSMEPRPPRVLHVCDDIACLTRGAEELCGQLQRTLGPAGSPTPDGKAIWYRSPCLGMCERAPAALMSAAGEHHREKVLAPVSAEQIAEALAGAARATDDARATNRNGATAEPPDHFDATVSVPQTRKNGSPGLTLLRRIGLADAESIDDYRAHGGYEALRRALDLGRAWVAREVAASRLVGRGGAAFPMARKWDPANQPQYLVCNADESEPGTFKDRVVMEGDPFSVVEAMTIAGYTTGCGKGYLYIRGEYPLAAERLAQAMAAARARGFLGDNILGRGARFDIEIRRGAGAYICGEETALFNSIEGFRGEPRSKPPFPTQAGLFGKPTVVNNVETLINVLPIVRDGGERYASIGTRDSTGPKLFCLSGHVARPGVYEVPFGASVRELIELAGGVAGSGRLQAVLLGGAAGAFISPAELDTPLTFEGTRSIGASLGSAVVMLFDDTVDLRKILLRIAAFFRDESCGQCVPCRVGTVRQEELLRRLVRGRAMGSLDTEMALLKQIGQVMRDASICGLGQTASSAIESALRRWPLFESSRPESAPGTEERSAP
ncbi:MAG TPA: NAD(P)H-dependent oxidoreductase subunit E [Terriglobia bacterium]|nr:NAD(P)H-dependent oxidoreductase subunit E [Terriglobia bacterium]